MVGVILASPTWDPLLGTYFLGSYGTDNQLGQGAHATGARIQSAFSLGVMSEGMDHAYRVTGNPELRERLVAMARYIEMFGLDPTYEYTGAFFGVVGGQPWHDYGAEVQVDFWDPSYTGSLVNALMRGYRYTCEDHFLTEAARYFERANKGIYGEPTERGAPDGTVHHFVDTVFDSSSGYKYLAYNKGELQYMYLFFMEVGVEL